MIKYKCQNECTQAQLSRKSNLFDIAAILYIELIELLSDKNILFLNKEKLSLLLQNKGILNA
jgi:hypothetical protein